MGRMISWDVAVERWVAAANAVETEDEQRRAIEDMRAVIDAANTEWMRGRRVHGEVMT